MNTCLMEQTPMRVKHRVFGILVQIYDEDRIKNA